MTTGGWIFLLISQAFVWGLTLRVVDDLLERLRAAP